MYDISTNKVNSVLGSKPSDNRDRAESRDFFIFGGVSHDTNGNPGGWRFLQTQGAGLLGEKTAQERAEELIQYCHRHIKRFRHEEALLYRIFYYDCPPIEKKSIIPYCKRLLISLKQIYINGQMNFLKSCEKNERWH